MSWPLCWSFSIVKQLELWSACLGDIAEIGWAQHCRCTLDNFRWCIENCTYSWRWSVAKWWQWKMSVLTATTLISAHGAIWNYPGCWHQMNPHINKSTSLKCWPNVKLMLYSVTPGTRCFYWGMSDWMSAWPKGLPNVKMTWCSTALGHQMPLLGLGLKPSKWQETYAAVPLASHSTPTPCFRTLCLNLPVKNQEKPP